MNLPALASLFVCIGLVLMLVNRPALAEYGRCLFLSGLVGLAVLNPHAFVHLGAS